MLCVCVCAPPPLTPQYRHQHTFINYLIQVSYTYQLFIVLIVYAAIKQAV